MNWKVAYGEPVASGAGSKTRYVISWYGTSWFSATCVPGELE